MCFVCVHYPQYHIGKVSLSEPQPMTSCPAMDDLDSALQCLEVKMEAEESITADMLVSSSESEKAIRTLLTCKPTFIFRIGRGQG